MSTSNILAIITAIFTYAFFKMRRLRLLAQQFQHQSRNHDVMSQQVTTSGGSSNNNDKTTSVHLDFMNPNPVDFLPLLPPRPRSTLSEKPTLVLDLDETLVHADPEMDVPINVDGRTLYLAVRPFAREFLESIAAHYELVVWTAGIESYGRAVVKLLDPAGSLISHSLFRQHCTIQEDGFSKIYLKDLSRLGRDERTRICDNNPDSFRLQPAAGILVDDFYGNPKDMFLKKLLLHLTKMALLRDLDLKFTPDQVCPRRAFVTTRVKSCSFVSLPEQEQELELELELEAKLEQVNAEIVVKNVEEVTQTQEPFPPVLFASPTIVTKRAPKKVLQDQPLRRSARLASKMKLPSPPSVRRSVRLLAKRVSEKAGVERSF